MKTVIVIPWREHPSRLEAFNRLIEIFTNTFPDFEIIVSDSTEEKFNLAQARNLGAKEAIARGADIIVFNDADLFVTPRSLLAAVKFSRNTGEPALPYTTYCQHNTVEETLIFFRRMNYNAKLGTIYYPPKILRDGLPNRLWPCSGCLVMPSKVFQEIGGFEEKIKGWGPEDTMLHRSYFDKYGKLFNYIDGAAQSTFNDPSYRGDKQDNQYYKDLVDFKDKR